MWNCLSLPVAYLICFPHRVSGINPTVSHLWHHTKLHCLTSFANDSDVILFHLSISCLLFLL